MAGDNVFVVAADEADFDATVASPVALDEHEDAPDALSDQDSVRLWHVDEDADLLDAMGPGDLVLFYRDGRYVGLGTVGATVHDDAGWAAGTLWADATSELLFTVEDYASVDLSRAAVHAIFDYSANYYPSTPMQVPADRVENSVAAIREAVVRYDRQE